jgi:hypothetical protein
VSVIGLLAGDAALKNKELDLIELNYYEMYYRCMYNISINLVLLNMYDKSKLIISVMFSEPLDDTCV